MYHLVRKGPWASVTPSRRPLHLPEVCNGLRVWMLRCIRAWGAAPLHLAPRDPNPQVKEQLNMQPAVARARGTRFASSGSADRRARALASCRRRPRPQRRRRSQLVVFAGRCTRLQRQGTFARSLTSCRSAYNQSRCGRARTTLRKHLSWLHVVKVSSGPSTCFKCAAQAKNRAALRVEQRLMVASRSSRRRRLYFLSCHG